MLNNGEKKITILTKRSKHPMLSWSATRLQQPSHILAYCVFYSRKCMFAHWKQGMYPKMNGWRGIRSSDWYHLLRNWAWSIVPPPTWVGIDFDRMFCVLSVHNTSKSAASLLCWSSTTYSGWSNSLSSKGCKDSGFCLGTSSLNGSCSSLSFHSLNFRTVFFFSSSSYKQWSFMHACPNISTNCFPPGQKNYQSSWFAWIHQYVSIY